MIKNNARNLGLDFDEFETYILKKCREKGIKVQKKDEKIDWRKFSISTVGYLEELKEIAKKKEGKCLSKNWLGTRVTYKFICKRGSLVLKPHLICM